MKYIIVTLLTTLFFSFPVFSQELTVKSFEPAPMDLTASTNPVKDLNGKVCGLVKVRLATAGATFQGSVIEPVKYSIGEYSVYMTDGAYRLTVKCPGCLPLDLNFRDYGIQRVESKQTYVLTLVLPSNSAANRDDGLRYLIIKVAPANATVFVDNNIQTTQDGAVSVLLPKGSHTYRVESGGFSPKSGTVEIGDSKKTIEVALESALAQLSVSCPTPGAQIYVNELLKGSSPWSGQLSAGNYQIEARHEGYRSQKQSIALQERENKTISLPALTALTGTLNVNYKPTDAEVWLDGKKIGTSPDIFRDIQVGEHTVEIKANNKLKDTKAITIRDGETTTLEGTLWTSPSSDDDNSKALTDLWNERRDKAKERAAQNPAKERLKGDLLSGIANYGKDNSSSSTSRSRMPQPEAVDLGLSVKWASCNLGASKPEEYGNYYKWGETEPADDKGEATYKYDNSIFDDKTKALKPEYDAAMVNLGGKWRMPTDVEIKELIDKCKSNWTTLNGINGIRVTGPNGNSIFLPASGYRGDDSGSLHFVGSCGCCWSSAPYSGDNGYGLYFGSGTCYPGGYYRANAFPVRSVLAE